MKKFIALLAVLLVGAGICFAADPAEGYWISYDEKTNEATAGWRIWVENGVLKGEILSLAGKPQDEKCTAGKGKSYSDFQGGADLSTITVVGTQWIWGLTQTKGEGNWGKGSIIDPGSGSKYACTITFHAADGKKYKEDTLEMRGSLGPFGRSQFWKRATQEAASGLR
jgi:uncharacterized protein (DUF2147 family)